MIVLRLIRNSFVRFKLKLYLALVVQALFPTIYRTVRMSLLGSLPSTAAVSIASQMTWIGVMLEVIDEGLLLPLYHCFGKALADKDDDNRVEIKNRVKSGLLISCLIYFVFGGSISIATPGLVKLMGQQTELLNETVPYIRIELGASIIDSLVKFSSLVLILYTWTTGLYIALTIQMLVSITMDAFLLSQLKVSLQLGVIGSAYSSLAASTATLTFLICYCYVKLGMHFWSDICCKYDFKWIRLWSRVGFFSALDSLSRNIVYLIVILRTMNLLHEQDSYWIANNFIWNFLLLPCQPLSAVIRQDVATGPSQGQINHWRKISAYLLINMFIISIWAATYPIWPFFLEHVLHAHQPELVSSLLIRLVPCYAFYAIGSLGNGVFYGLGKTHILLAISSFVSAGLVTCFLLATNQIIPLTVDNIAFIFGGGLIFGALQTVVAYFYVVRKNNGKM